MLTPWRRSLPPTVAWDGPVTFRCERCHRYHEEGSCPPEPAADADEPGGTAG